MRRSERCVGNLDDLLPVLQREVTAIEGWADGASTRRIRFRVPSVLLPGRRFQLLFSIRTHPETWAWSETWQWASAPR